jgi:hypothetical protein
MTSVAMVGLVIVAAAYFSVPAHAQTADDSLKIYAVNVVKTPPLQKPVTGDGIYLGEGVVITAAHVVGHWPFFTRPHVLIGGQDLPGRIIKEGSFETTDLALLSVEDAQLPVSLRLRRNPLCKEAPKIGMLVIDVDAAGTMRAQVISPLTIAPELRTRFDTLISSEEGSGSGLFDAERKCLVGIMSAKIPKFNYQLNNGRMAVTADGFAGYFVSASKIANFIPENLRF